MQQTAENEKDYITKLKGGPSKPHWMRPKIEWEYIGHVMREIQPYCMKGMKMREALPLDPFLFYRPHYDISASAECFLFLEETLAH